MEIKCNKCNGTSFRKNGYSRSGDPRYKCKTCGSESKVLVNKVQHQHTEQKQESVKSTHLCCSSCNGTSFQKKGTNTLGIQLYRCKSCGSRKTPMLVSGESKQTNSVFNKNKQQKVVDQKQIENVINSAIKSTINKTPTNFEHITKPDFKHRRVLAIPDTHFPFEDKDYLKFVKQVYDEYKCDTVVHLGDLIDNHYTSYHETDPDGKSAGEELRCALESIRELCSVFPEMYIMTGNHDRLPNRKAFSEGVSKTWIKTIKDIILSAGIPAENWHFYNELVIDDVTYTHGEGRAATTRMTQDLESVVCGHHHSKSYIQYAGSRSNPLFALQLGALIDDESYAFAYGKNFKKCFKNCGVIIDGKMVHCIPMNMYIQK